MPAENQTAPTGNEVAKANDQVAKMRDLLAKYKGHIEGLIPAKLNAERMLRIAQVNIGRIPKLAECTPASMLGAVLESTRQGLEPGAGPGHTWMIPYLNRKKGRYEVQLITDYRGLIKLMRRGAGVASILAQAVHQNDEWDLGADERGLFFSWKPSKGDRGAPTHYAFVAWDKDNKVLAYSVKTVAEVKKVMARSAGKSSGPWQTDFEAMAIKTVIRSGAKLLPSDDEFQRIISMDEASDLGLPQDLGVIVDPTETATPKDEYIETEAIPMPEEENVSPDNDGGTDADDAADLFPSREETEARMQKEKAGGKRV